MSEKEQSETLRMSVNEKSLSESREIVSRIVTMSGSQALNMILDSEKPGALVRSMAKVDLFWLIKKIGADDCVPILRLASNEQWEYVLDMELWTRDRIDIKETFGWLARLNEADPNRLTKWFLSEDGNLLAHFFLNHAIQVVIRDVSDDDFIIPEGYSTLDNLYYYRILDKENEATIVQILRGLVTEDYDRYQALMLGLAGVLPSDVEEEMYRLKSVRLAETGYLPFEEAISVYSHQKVELIEKDKSDYLLYSPDQDETMALVPVMPFVESSEDNILERSVIRISDAPVLDRIRLEFAGLCNQIFSADGERFEDIDVLKRVSRKAGGYINIGLELLSHGNLATSEAYIRNHPLLTIFQVGFGKALELKWEAQKWIKISWFANQGLENEFWGDEWGGILEGITKNKPVLYTGSGEAEFRNFEAISELESCAIILHRMMVLDLLIQNIAHSFSINKNILTRSDLNFRPFLFNTWAIEQLKLEPLFKPLTIEQAREFFRFLRKDEKTVPFDLSEFREIFIECYMSVDLGFDQDDIDVMRETLTLLWDEFMDEYAEVRAEDMNARYIRHLLISEVE